MKLDIKKIPENPGVYTFFNISRDIIYIGKAKNLRRRLASYFQKRSDITPGKDLMKSEIADVDYTILNSENEALLLEAHLIKKHQPKYNIVLRDDKNWTYIVKTSEPFPRIITVHGNRNIKGTYYGPYTSAYAAKSVLRLIHRLIPLRTCRRDLSRLPRGRVCFQYALGNCLGPCEKKIDSAAYDKLLRQVEDILKGRGKKIYLQLKKLMREASRSQHYEKAANLRDKIYAWEKVFQPQNVERRGWRDQDIVTVITAEAMAVATVMQVRQSRVSDKIQYSIRNPLNLPAEQVLEEFLLQYYTGRQLMPPEILLKTPLRPAVLKALRPIIVRFPRRGSKRELLNLSEKNGWFYYQRWRGLPPLPPALTALQAVLHLPELPVRIEAYDISNISGRFATGSMVVWQNGKPAPGQFRKFKIKNIEGPNDVMMMREVMTRRLAHTEWPEPQLVVLDGGKPQLSAVTPVLPEPWRIKIIALAKKQEEVFTPQKPLSLKLPKSHPASLLLQNIRNQAHRQAIRYYRHLHSRSLGSSR